MQREQITCLYLNIGQPPSVARKIYCAYDYKAFPHFSGDELGETSFPVFT
jgi:hypothetical protein